MNLAGKLIALCLVHSIIADKIHPHLHPEIKIVGYNGPLDDNVMTLFKGAEYVEFFECNITSVSGSVYSKLPKLKKLYIENNTYSNVDNRNVLQGAVTLEDFHFINNKLDEIDLTTLRNLPNLRLFRVEGLRNKEPVKIIANSFNGTNFHDFVFRNNNLIEIDAGAFNGVDNLQKLDLADNKLKSFTKEVIPHSKQLEILDLSGNLLESFSADNLPEVPKLRELNLSKNPFKNLNLDAINTVAPNLKKLYLAETPIPKFQLEELQKKNKFDIILTHFERERNYSL